VREGEGLENLIEVGREGERIHPLKRSIANCWLGQQCP
jgi:hypothetical protein